MKHFFISHAGKDSDIARRLCNDLKDVGHDVCIDLHELTLGDDTIEFMNSAIQQRPYRRDSVFTENSVGSLAEARNQCPSLE